MASAVFLGIEMSVGLLMGDEPFERGLHGRFGFGRTAATAQHRRTIARRAVFVDLRQRGNGRQMAGRAGRIGRTGGGDGAIRVARCIRIQGAQPRRAGGERAAKPDRRLRLNE